MVILGLGSNIGDRLHYLRAALQNIKHIPDLTIHAISPVYISDALLPEGAPSSWDHPYFNLALRCETTLSPCELLAHVKQIEALIGRAKDKVWGPRIIDIDLLAWDDLIRYDAKLHIPHEQLHKRPFALWPLADVAPDWLHPILKKTAAELVTPWGSRFSGASPLHTKQIPHRIDTPQLVGILNITPDSFSDGGKFAAMDAALEHAHSLLHSGAEIIDIGAESTGPHATPLSPDIEWQRLEPVIKHLLSEKSRFLVPPKISIDTRHPGTAEKALALQVDWINDVSGLDNLLMQQVVKNSDCDIVFMHHLGVPVDKNNFLPHDADVIDLLYRFAEERLQTLNIDPARLIFDVGIGYGKTPAQSIELLKNISVFQKLGVRLLVGHSRKSFLSHYTDQPAAERDLETLVISLALANQAVDFLRVHDVRSHARAYKVANAFGLSHTFCDRVK